MIHAVFQRDFISQRNIFQAVAVASHGTVLASHTFFPSQLKKQVCQLRNLSKHKGEHKTHVYIKHMFEVILGSVVFVTRIFADASLLEETSYKRR